MKKIEVKNINKEKVYQFVKRGTVYVVEAKVIDRALDAGKGALQTVAIGTAFGLGTDIAIELAYSGVKVLNAKRKQIVIRKAMKKVKA